MSIDLHSRFPSTTTQCDTTFHIQPNNESNYEQPMKEATSQFKEESAHEERYASTRVRRAPGWFKDYVV
ncbi:hypothetical protein WN944_010360 [Citrus x changshan-huyou]|uniref:Uncharacterized protein n=1 Tax=Citrus x changshan-huyou TaxID=2935761 RepID=A0AAP0MUR2_9ROSI